MRQQKTFYYFQWTQKPLICVIDGQESVFAMFLCVCGCHESAEKIQSESEFVQFLFGQFASNEKDKSYYFPLILVQVAITNRVKSRTDGGLLLIEN